MDFPTKNIYFHMKNRCYLTTDISYPLYGGRGITVCDRWLGKDGRKNFELDMGSRPSALHSLDRIDVNGMYEPQNCRWATPKEQSSNKRNNIFVELNGSMVTLKEYCRIRNMKYKTVWMRINGYGWSMERAIGK